MTELISLEIGFENCEVISFEAAEVASIDINEITKEFHKVWNSNHIRKVYNSADVVLVFPPEANKKTNYLNTVFERIRTFNDITDITIKDNKDVYCVTVTWDKDNDENNHFQTSDFLSDGSLVVVISKTRTAAQMKNEIDKKIQEIDEIRQHLK